MNYDIKDILERSIDAQYQSNIWGEDKYSSAIYRLLMDHSSGILRTIEDYRTDDIKSWNKVNEDVSKLLSLLKMGLTYDEIVDKYNMFWHKTYEYIEETLHYGSSLTLKIKNNTYNGVSSDEEMKIVLEDLKKILNLLPSKLKKIKFIHDNKYRYAFKIIFEKINL